MASATDYVNENQEASASTSQQNSAEAADTVGAALGALGNPTEMIEKAGDSLRVAGRELGRNSAPYLRDCLLEGLLEGLAEAVEEEDEGDDFLSQVEVPEYSLPSSPSLSAPIARLKAASA